MYLTFEFWKCEYQIKGVRLKNGTYEDVNINGKETKENSFIIMICMIIELLIWIINCFCIC